MTRLTSEQKYAVLSDPEPLYEGRFVSAVKSTGIFCRPSCPAKKPKPGNVVFYDTTKEALQNGYRPCKLCKPMQSLEDNPAYLGGLIKDLQQNPYLRLKDQDLRKRGIDPGRISRWFKKRHGITFHAFQRMLRINQAFKQLAKRKPFPPPGEPLSVLEAGTASIFGRPSADAEQAILNITRFATPLGPMFACASCKGLYLLEFTDRRMLETEFKDIRKRLNAVITRGSNPHLTQVRKEMREYFTGQRFEFTVPLHYPGTRFQRSVWELLLTLPYGRTRSYREQAELLGKPSAVRAVGRANGHNRISIIIPCHRVLGSDGSLTGYGGGLHRKQWLLDFERANATE
jgi:AraC family transcriptional regulator of adaptative response/methylated-DNA-[protein]-cysteine methyltransferase